MRPEREIRTMRLRRHLSLLPAAVAMTLLAAAGGRAEQPVQAADPWFRQGAVALGERLALRPVEGRARNVILFVADGAGIGINTAIRIAEGQRHGLTGEENVLAWERFPYLALAKTYNTDARVPDSAATATAMLTGVKTRKGVLGVGPEVEPGDCAGALAHPLTSLGELAEARGLATGIVTTTRLTHATPAAVYAHAPDRNWEDDFPIPPGAPCTDIARQLVAFPFEVALGGGRRHFLPDGQSDIEGAPGLRGDGRDLVAEWRTAGPGRVVVQTGPEFDRLAAAPDRALPERVLGLFGPSHMAYEADRPADQGGEPSLAGMTRLAIRMLARDPQGYLLLVEAGRIDQALHALDFPRAVIEGMALDEAVAAAVELTDPAETLIIVTADHDDPLPPWSLDARGTPVIDSSSWNPRDFPPPEEPMAARREPGTMAAILAVLQALVSGGPGAPKPAGPGGHGPADVAIHARGPMAHLVGGTVEQSYIFHVISHALGFDSGG